MALNETPDQLAINTIRMLAVDAVQQANSGHRGTPMKAAPTACQPPAIGARVSVEEGATIGWDRYAGPGGIVLGMHSFGMSAPIKAVSEHFGFTANHVAEAARRAIGRGG